MKRILNVTISLFFIGSTLISCKKDWTCQCEPENNTNLTVEHFPIEKHTKKEAISKCKTYNTEALDCNLR